jgi:hypothetical protein
MDIRAEVLNTVNYAGGQYSWGCLDTGDSYSRVFVTSLCRSGHTCGFGPATIVPCLPS